MKEANYFVSFVYAKKDSDSWCFGNMSGKLPKIKKHTDIEIFSDTILVNLRLKGLNIKDLVVLNYKKIK